MSRERDGKREAYWRRMVRRRAASGMTIADFCEQEGLKTSTYHFWQRELRRRDEEEESQTTDSTIPAGLVPVQVVDDRGVSASVEVVAANGFVVRVGQDATIDQVRQVLQVVSELG